MKSLSNTYTKSNKTCFPPCAGHQGWTSKSASRVLSDLFPWDQTLQLRMPKIGTLCELAKKHPCPTFQTSRERPPSSSQNSREPAKSSRRGRRGIRCKQLNASCSLSSQCFTYVGLTWVAAWKTVWVSRSQTSRISLALVMRARWFIHRLSFRVSNHIYTCLTKPIDSGAFPSWFPERRMVRVCEQWRTRLWCATH